MSRIEDLLSQLTLDEKISMLAASDLWYSTPVPRLNIPFFQVADGPNGVRGVWSKMSAPSAATPVGIALGATWNPKLVEKIGNVLADEVKAKNGKHPARPDRQHPPHTDRGAKLRVFFRRPVSQRHDRLRLHQRLAG